MPTYMGEEEVIKKNMALAQEQIYNVEYMEAAGGCKGGVD